MNIIPLQAIPAQALAVILDGQNCDIRLYWRSRLYIDLDVDGENIFCGQKVLDKVPLPLFRYQAFKGRLIFADMLDLKTPQNPQHSELGGRYKLIYLSEADIAEIKGDRN
jgi:hypothetical protein